MKRSSEHVASGIVGAVVGAIALAAVSDWLASHIPDPIESADADVAAQLSDSFDRERFRKVQKKCDPRYAEALRSSGARIELRPKTRGVDVFLPPTDWSGLDDQGRWILGRYFSICSFADGPANVVIRQGDTGRERARYIVGEGYRSVE